MELSYNQFDNIIEKTMGDFVFGGDVTEYLYNYYGNSVLDDELLIEITSRWHEETLWVDDDIDGIFDILHNQNKEQLIEWLTKQDYIEDVTSIHPDSLFISTENVGRFAWKRANHQAKLERE